MLHGRESGTIDTKKLGWTDGTAMTRACPTCGAGNAGEARFCRRCGAALLEVIAPQPAASAPARGRLLAWGGAGLLAGALVAAAATWGWHERRAAGQVAAAVQQADQRHQAELRAVHRRYEEVEQARIDAEQQSSHFFASQQAARREADATRAELKAAAARAAREAQGRREEGERARLLALERKRAEEQAAAAAAARTPAVVPPPPPARPPPLPKPAAPVQQTAQASPEALCRSMTNFITRGICETRECIKPQYIASDYCRSLRARASPPSQQP